MQNLSTLDVTILDPRLKHPTIFEKFDQLGHEEAYIIHNDHDPLPLYYQLLGERGPNFTWDYLLNGPTYWEVKITKNSNDTKQPTIGEIVAKDYRKADVFKKYNLDFCCGGKKTVLQACIEKKVNFMDVDFDLNQIDKQNQLSNFDFDQWELDILIDYILETHHGYLNKSIPVLIDYTHKVSKVHGDTHPEVREIAQKFKEAAIELVDHMEKEESILFPYIKSLVNTKFNITSASNPVFGNINNPISMMEHEHEQVGNLLKSISTLSNNFNPPEGACTTFKISYLKLKEFETDLHQHIHLENNILFPKSIQLEQALLKKDLH